MKLFFMGKHYSSNVILCSSLSVFCLLGLVPASHCEASPLSLNSSSYGQPWISSIEHLIGIEVQINCGFQTLPWKNRVCYENTPYTIIQHNTTTRLIDTVFSILLLLLSFCCIGLFAASCLQTRSVRFLSVFFRPNWQTDNCRRSLYMIKKQNHISPHYLYTGITMMFLCSLALFISVQRKYQ